jgi:hypothetical protein
MILSAILAGFPVLFPGPDGVCFQVSCISLSFWASLSNPPTFISPRLSTARSALSLSFRNLLTLLSLEASPAIYSASLGALLSFLASASFPAAPPASSPPLLTSSIVRPGFFAPALRLRALRLRALRLRALRLRALRLRKRAVSLRKRADALIAFATCMKAPSVSPNISPSIAFFNLPSGRKDLLSWRYR